MLKSILNSGLRHILRNRSFSLINLLGLSVSMSLGLLIIVLVKGQFAFDKFHSDPERIYRINTTALRTGGGAEPYASTPLPLATVLAKDYTFIEHVVRLDRQLNGDATVGTTIVPVHGHFADPTIFSVFNFPLESGNPETALAGANSLVLTRKASIKLFGNTNSLGQSVSIKGYGDFVVTGVLKEYPGKTHFDFELLASTDALNGLTKQGVVSASLDDWNNYYTGYVYFKLKRGHEPEEVDAALANIAKSRYANLKLETRDKGYLFAVQPLKDITPGPMLSNQMGSALPAILLIFLGALAAIVMIMACFNYTNLMIAKSLTRAREIGIRKIIGAQRWQVFFQFVGEAVLFALLCLIFSYGLFEVMKPAFLQLHVTGEFAIDLSEDVYIYALFVLFALTVGIVAGILPAIYLSAFKPLNVLRDAAKVRIYSRTTLRKILMVSQFALSLVFVTVVIVLYRQIDYLLTADYGFRQDDILDVHLQGIPYERAAAEVRKIGGVVTVGGISHSLGTWEDRSSDYRRTRADEPFVMRDYLVDENFLANVDIQFMSGGNFDAAHEGSLERHVIINESALVPLGFANPTAAIGQSIFAEDSLHLTVIGVVRDFNFRPLSNSIEPLAIRYQPGGLNVLSARITPGSEAIVKESMTKVLGSLDPIHTYAVKTMSEELDQAYVDAGITDLLAITGYVAFVAIGLACLGILGMAMYSTQTRIKEIGVRKVMGARRLDMILLLSRSFLMLIGISVVAGMPLAYFLSSAILQEYAYRIALTPLLLLSGVMIISFLGIVTICSQTVRAASSNPVESLRYE